MPHMYIVRRPIVMQTFMKTKLNGSLLYEYVLVFKKNLGNSWCILTLNKTHDTHFGLLQRIICTRCICSLTIILCDYKFNQFHLLIMNYICPDVK